MKNIDLKIAIFATGTNQREVAKSTGIPANHLSMAVNGRYILDATQKAKIADFLKRPENELFKRSIE